MPANKRTPSPSPRRSPSPGAGGRGAESPRRASPLARVSGTASPPPLGTPAPSIADGEEVARFLAVNLSAGLASADVESRRAQVGPNTLRGGGPPPLIKIIFQLSCFSPFFLSFAWRVCVRVCVCVCV